MHEQANSISKTVLPSRLLAERMNCLPTVHYREPDDKTSRASAEVSDAELAGLMPEHEMTGTSTYTPDGAYGNFNKGDDICAIVHAKSSRVCVTLTDQHCLTTLWHGTHLCLHLPLGCPQP